MIELGEPCSHELVTIVALSGDNPAQEGGAVPALCLIARRVR